MTSQLKFIETPPEAIQKPIRKGKARLKKAVRNQIEFKVGSLDDFIPADHMVRLVWDYVQKLDMSHVLETIQSLEGSVGRPATDPKILLALWLYATLDGIVSARMIADYCVEHVAYQWLCGGVKMNHHTLSDFAVNHGEQFDDFITQSVAILMKQGWVNLEEVSQDGMRVRANAGSASFKKEEKLQIYHEKAKSYLASLRKELKDNPSASRSKKEAAALRAAEEKEKKLREAIDEISKIRDEKKSNKSHKPKAEDLEKTKASTTDPHARKMKMPDGGFRPAYNVQFVSSKKGKVIVGVDVSSQGNDKGMIVGMIKKVHNKFHTLPLRWLIDSGYSDYKEINRVQEEWNGCTIYMPLRAVGEKDPYEPLPRDSTAIVKLRERMKSEEGKEVYKGRSSTAEFSNAQVRNYGLRQFLVRGLTRVKSTAYRFALAHNMQRFFSLSRGKRALLIS